MRALKTTYIFLGIAGGFGAFLALLRFYPIGAAIILGLAILAAFWLLIYAFVED